MVLPVHHQSLRLSQPHMFADRQNARINRVASDRLLVKYKWRYCCRFWALHGVGDVPIGALLVVLQQWLLVASVCRTFSGWLRFVVVFAAVPLGVSCFLTCRVGDTYWLLRTFHRNIRPQAAAASCAHAS